MKKVYCHKISGGCFNRKQAAKTRNGQKESDFFRHNLIMSKEKNQSCQNNYTKKGTENQALHPINIEAMIPLCIEFL